MAKRFVYTDPATGNVHIAQPAPKSRLLLPRKGFPPVLEPEALWLQRIAARIIPPDAQDVHVIEEEDIPRDRTFRNAWKHRAGVISVDMPKARDVHRNNLRRARKPMLELLDVEGLRAIESNDNELLEQVKTGKQLLRDAPAHPDIEAAQTPEELKAIWPLEVVTPMPVEVPKPLGAPKRAPGHTKGWVGKLVGQIVPEEEEFPIETPAPVVPTEPEPEEVFHIPPPEAEPVAPDDATLRRAAKAHIRKVASSFAFSSAEDQLRYEEALLAHNGNASAVQTFEPAAAAVGLTVAAYAEQIINARRLAARKLMRVRAVQDLALQQLDSATGDQIAAIERKAIADMHGEANAISNG
jgi:hypothetical protein